MKVFVEDSSHEYISWLPNASLVFSPEEADLILFSGGEDVCPYLYGEPVGAYTSYNKDRDVLCTDLYKYALSQEKMMLGICRGAQFLCVMNGGKLVQHQDNTYIHDMEVLIPSTKEVKNIKITSTHHQAMYLPKEKNINAEILGYTKDVSQFHLDGNGNEMEIDRELEIVFFPDTKSLCIQGHPEIKSFQVQYPESIKTLKDILFHTLIGG